MGINGEWDEIWGSRHGTKRPEWNRDEEEGTEREGMRMKTGEVGRREGDRKRMIPYRLVFPLCVLAPLRRAGPPLWASLPVHNPGGGDYQILIHQRKKKKSK